MHWYKCRLERRLQYGCTMQQLVECSPIHDLPRSPAVTMTLGGGSTSGKESHSLTPQSKLQIQPTPQAA